MKIPTRPTAEIDLPREVEKLYDLAFNLWWTWTPAADRLFSMIDPAQWALYRNPVQLLINVPRGQWGALLANESFLSLYTEVIEAFDAYMHPPEPTWFENENRSWNEDDLIGYFSMEYGLHHTLAIYSGGLGVLSGDHCKSASDLGVPMVAIGLLYRHGYFQQTIDAEGYQQHYYPEYDFTRLPLRPVATRTGKEVHVTVPMPGRDVNVRLWLAQVGRVPLILLDTDLPENDAADRPITNQLYVRGREMRLLQELVLGVGGVRALDALGMTPKVWHMNEGHSAFLQMERWRRLENARDLGPQAACDRLRPNVVFTTHTPVPAGNEQFDAPVVLKYLRSWCEEVGCPEHELLALGKARDEDVSFNLTALAIRTASWVNGVSKLNAEVAGDMWRHLFARDGFYRDAAEAEGQNPDASDWQVIRAVTNGIHTSTWMGPEMNSLLQRHMGPNWNQKLLSNDGWEPVYAIPDDEFWAARRAQKERLGRFSCSRIREQLARHGESPDALRAAEGLFNPEALTIGFARRFATYKRASLVFSELDRLRRLLADEERPIQFFFAGKAHPADRPGQDLIRRIVDLGRNDDLAGRVFFLENYDMRMGKMLVQGVDVWLNTPRRPMEASGTSGQKAAANGTLNFSILDGWWPEGYNGENGWPIGGEVAVGDENQQDRDDVASLYETLEQVILPLYFDRDERDLPRRWIKRMKDSVAGLTPQFSADRMVRDYVVEAYAPAARRA